MASKKKVAYKSIATLVVYPEAGLSERAAARRVMRWLMEVAVQIEMEHRQLPRRFVARLVEPVKKGGGR